MRERSFLDCESPKRVPCAKLNWVLNLGAARRRGRPPSSAGVKGALVPRCACLEKDLRHLALDCFYGVVTAQKGTMNA